MNLVRRHLARKVARQFMASERPGWTSGHLLPERESHAPDRAWFHESGIALIQRVPSCRVTGNGPYEYTVWERYRGTSVPVMDHGDMLTAFRYAEELVEQRTMDQKPQIR